MFFSSKDHNLVLSKTTNHTSVVTIVMHGVFDSSNEQAHTQAREQALDKRSLNE
jgi:hypothetical protein